MISRLKQNASRILTLTKQFHRELHLTRTLQLYPSEVNEVRIPVPWGHIAGKWWGNTNKQPILGLHGWQDNAGSFDPLLKILPITQPVLVIDIPGHGFSSHIPPGITYEDANYIFICRRIQQYFKWDKKMTILGHSQGGVIGFVFAAIYPECVNALITLDVIKPYAAKPSYFDKLCKYADRFIDISSRPTDLSPSYSLEEIEDRWIKGVRGALTPQSVKILMKRGVKLDKPSGKYTFTRDQRLKVLSLHRLSEDECLELARNIRCHYLSIKCSKGGFIDAALKNAPDFISVVSENTKSFKFVTVEGSHFAHLNNPENVAPVITEFLNTVNS